MPRSAPSFARAAARGPAFASRRGLLGCPETVDERNPRGGAGGRSLPVTRRRRARAALLAALLAAVAAPGAAGEIAAGQPLEAALAELVARGLRLVWSSVTVDPRLAVLATPAASEPRAILDELLAPHGLAVEAGPAGSLIVTAAREQPTGTLRGRVRSRAELAPVAGARVHAGDAPPAVTGADGRFELSGLTPGPHGVEIRRPGYVIEARDGVEIRPGAATELDVLLQAAPLAGEQITVHPSQVELLDEGASALVTLDRDDIAALPQLGGDVFRALTLLPGTAGNDWTAQIHVRGGRRDEVMVLLDGQELYDAYHLEDFDNALSAVPAALLGSLKLTTGGYGSSYGDRMGGVLDMTSRAPSPAIAGRISLSVLDAQVEAGGGGAGGIDWLLAARRGATDLAARLFGREDPSFWDLLAKLERPLGSGQFLRANFLAAADRLLFRERPDGELRAFDTRYGSSYAWLAHQILLSDRLFVDSALSASRIERDRKGREDEEEKRFDVADRRELEVGALVQSWHFQAGARHALRAGFELRHYSADYDYRSFREFASPFARLRAEPRAGRFDFRDELDDRYLGAFLSDRFRPAPDLTLELGLRYDRHTLTDGALASPRASLAWRLSEASALRLAWGIYRQGQRAYELAVEDGDTALYPAERGEHRVIGFERRFPPTAGFGLIALRAEAYERRIANPRPRYENLFEPFEPFDEGELDRVRIAPESSRARGAELFLAGRAGERIGWWLDYTWAKSEDEIGGRRIPRQIDQRHALNADLDLRLGRAWRLNLAWRFHTGRPTTPVGLEPVADESGEIELVPVLGPLNSERLPAEHRLDLRLSRSWSLSRGRWTLFLDAQNVYDRRNVAGFDLEVDEEAGAIRATPEPWPGFFASAGVTWEF